MSALGVVLDGVVGTEADPLGKGAVLPLLLGKSALGAEGLLGRLLGRETEDDEEGKKKVRNEQQRNDAKSSRDSPPVKANQQARNSAALPIRRLGKASLG